MIEYEWAWEARGEDKEMNILYFFADVYRRASFSQVAIVLSSLFLSTNIALPLLVVAVAVAVEDASVPPCSAVLTEAGIVFVFDVSIFFIFTSVPGKKPTRAHTHEPLALFLIRL